MRTYSTCGALGLVANQQPATSNQYQQPVPATSTSNQYQQPVPATSTSNQYQQPVPATSTSNQYQQPVPATSTSNHHCFFQRLFVRSTSGNTCSGSISMAVTLDAPSRVTGYCPAPQSPTSTGITWRSTRPSLRVTARRTGIGARPRSSIVTTSLPPDGT